MGLKRGTPVRIHILDPHNMLYLGCNVMQYHNTMGKLIEVSGLGNYFIVLSNGHHFYFNPQDVTLINSRWR